MKALDFTQLPVSVGEEFCFWGSHGAMLNVKNKEM